MKHLNRYNRRSLHRSAMPCFRTVMNDGDWKIFRNFSVMMRIGLLAACLMLPGLLCGCSDSKKPAPAVKLIQVNDSVITVKAFEKALIHATEDVATGSKIDPDILSQIRLRLLNQVIERLILMERAEELQIGISNEELEAAIESIRGDYPEGEFEKVLLEQAVSYNQWKDDLKIRLLMEKVIHHELDPQITISAEEVSAYYEAHYMPSASGPDKNKEDQPVDDIIVQQVRNQKREEAYHAWITSLQQRYKIDINQEAWEKVKNLQL